MTRASHRKPFASLEWDRRSDAQFKPAELQLWSETIPPQATQVHSANQGRIIHGENASVMMALLEELEGQIDLIYADPPFLTGKAYHARIGQGDDSRSPKSWRTTQGFQDTWSNGAAYLDMLFPRLQLMHTLLSESGTLYLHLDWHASAYARVLLDEIFGPDRLINEIVWVYHGPSPIRSAFNRKHDTILAYSKSKEYTFNADDVRVAYNPSTIKTFNSSSRAGFGKQPDLERGKVPEDWWYFPVVARLHKERTGYPTQKPEALLERIILASSNPDDLVADFFSGSGTSVSVAARLKRRWLACDPAPTALITAYRRLLMTSGVEPFALWKTADTKDEPTLDLEAKITTNGTQVEARIETINSSDPTELNFPRDLVLWEIDWSHKDAIFKSQSQAIRSWRSDEISLHLQHEYSSPGAYELRIRAFDSQGRYGLSSHQIQIKR
jgi:DNA modification methylase